MGTWSTRLPVVMWPLPSTTLRISGIKWAGRNCTTIAHFWRGPWMWVTLLECALPHLHIPLVDHLQKCHFVHRHPAEEKRRANPLFSGRERLQSLWGGKGFWCTKKRETNFFFLSTQLISGRFSDFNYGKLCSLISCSLVVNKNFPYFFFAVLHRYE